jgi:hypothetical protein
MLVLPWACWCTRQIHHLTRHSKHTCCTSRPRRCPSADRPSAGRRQWGCLVLTNHLASPPHRSYTTECHMDYRWFVRTNQPQTTSVEQGTASGGSSAHDSWSGSWMSAALSHNRSTRTGRGPAVRATDQSLQWVIISGVELEWARLFTHKHTYWLHWGV